MNYDPNIGKMIFFNNFNMKGLSSILKLWSFISLIVHSMMHMNQWNFWYMEIVVGYCLFVRMKCNNILLLVMWIWNILSICWVRISYFRLFDSWNNFFSSCNALNFVKQLFGFDLDLLISLKVPTFQKKLIGRKDKQSY